MARGWVNDRGTDSSPTCGWMVDLVYDCGNNAEGCRGGNSSAYPSERDKRVQEWPGDKDTRTKAIGWGISPNMLIGVNGFNIGASCAFTLHMLLPYVYIYIYIYWLGPVGSNGFTTWACTPHMLLPFIYWPVHSLGGCYPFTATGGPDSRDATNDGNGSILGGSHRMRRPSGAKHRETSDLGNLSNMVRAWLAYEEMMYITSNFLDSG